jgi:ribonucleoside-diphosphate reductase alpha chain
MSSILNWYVEEGTIFKGGSGSGINLSRIRSSAEQLNGGGHRLGPVSFMRGADASAGTIKSGGKTRRAAKMVILNADHPDIEDFIWCKALEERKARVLSEAGFDMDLDGKDYASIQYQNANNSVRVTDEFMQAVLDDADWDLVAVTTGEVVRTGQGARPHAPDLRGGRGSAPTPACSSTPPSTAGTPPRARAGSTGRTRAASTCPSTTPPATWPASTCCPYLADDDDDVFDVAAFTHTVEVFFTAQEILVGNADYPTEGIAETTRRFRQLGLGYANLGATLMALGLPYDSEAGRAWAGAITALMTGHAYATSARTAGRMGPFAGYTENEEHVLRVLRMHRAAAAEIDGDLVPTALLGAAQRSWDTAVELGRGQRRAQQPGQRPRPDGHHRPADGLRHHRHRARPRALQDEEAGRRRHHDDRQPDRAPGPAPPRLHPGAGGRRRRLHRREQVDPRRAPRRRRARSRLRLLHGRQRHPLPRPHHDDGAVQPFLSGAISKTVNVPEWVTVEQVEQLHIEAWQLGIKAVAIYRDNCKVAQPLAMAKKEVKEEAVAAVEAGADPVQVVERIVERITNKPTREKLPRNRQSRTFEFRVADCKGFVTVGEYDDGRPGELFLRVSKQGSTLAGIMDAFAISVSHGLQYGVPLHAFVEAFTNMRFEPAGMTDDADIRFASSLLDYIFRRLAVDYLPLDQRMELGILSVGERTNPTLPGIEESTTATAAGQDIIPDPPSSPASVLDLAPPAPTPPAPNPVRQVPTAHSDAPYCMQCGVQMQRAGSCHACPSCGSTSGCS